MRILILNWKDLAHPRAGGAEVFTERVGRRLVERGHEITLVCSSVAGRPSDETVEGVSVVRRGGRLGVYREARRFWNEWRGPAFDVVIDEINTRPFMTPRWLAGTPIVALIHQLAREVWFYETPLPVATIGRYLLEPWWLRAYRDIPALTVSASSAASLHRYHGWNDITVVPEGLDPMVVPVVEKELSPTVVFLGRLVGMKRPKHAVRAFEILRSRFPEARLWVIGDGPQRREISRRRPAGVEFLGRLSEHERNRRLAAAHVLIATSVREGWGLNVSEAAACGTPSIGYAVPGLRDSVGASGGIVVAPRCEAMGDALIRFFEGSIGARPIRSTVSWETVAEAVERRLDGVVARVRHPVHLNRRRERVSR